MMTRFVPTVAISVAALLAGCAPAPEMASAAIPASSAEPAGSAIPERDIMAAAAKIQGATVLDVDRFSPVTTLGESCTVRPLMNATTPQAPKLVAALEAAKMYSLEQQGVALLVMQDGEVLHRSFAEGVDAATPTDSYSMHKSVLALVIGNAIEDGVIASLDDPVGKYIAEWNGDPRGEITLRQVLNMATGLKYAPSPEGVPALLNLMFSPDINDVALHSVLSAPPGGIFAYGNYNSQVAGIVLERALKTTGKGSYAEYLEKTLWCPIGNNDADLWLDREGGSPHYFAALFTHIENWARLGELIRNDGMVDGESVVPTSWIAEMAKPSTANPAYGLHIWRGVQRETKRSYGPNSPLKVIHSAPYLADDVLFFDGFGGQRVYVIPSAGITIARTGMVNLDYDDAKIVNMVLAGLE